MRALLLLAALVATLGTVATAAPVPGSRTAQEAAFLHSVNPRNTAYVVTGNLMAFAGTRVAYACHVDGIVRPGIILGDCGSEAEPMDLFVKLPTEHLRVGDRVRVLGVLERPATWSDITGHTVYYAFLRAVFVDRLP